MVIIFICVEEKTTDQNDMFLRLRKQLGIIKAGLKFNLN